MDISENRHPYFRDNIRGSKSLNSSFGTCHSINGSGLFPVREGSVVLRYIPDPTDRFLDHAFQPAPDYMNQNGHGVSDLMNPVYQHPGPPRTILPTISSDDSEYLNCFKDGAAGPEYLNEIQPAFIYPTSNGSAVHSVQKFQPQTSMDNPDYQQDFTPTAKTHANGHLPAAENAEYLGPN